MTVPSAAMGNRGELPCYFPIPPQVTPRWLAGMLEIPGVVRAGEGLRCGWDIAWAVARLLNVPELPIPTHDGELPGLARYRELGLHTKTRRAQKEDILFLARRGGAILAEPTRSGKSVMALAASILIDARRTLIICPKVARFPWADEIQTWCGEEAVLLCGRGGREVRIRCNTCSGTGVVGDAVCAACRMRNGQANGYRLVHAEPMQPRTARTAEGHKYSVLPRVNECRRHGVTTTEPYAFCGQCQDEVLATIERARYVVLNYELTVPQHSDIGGGTMVLREDLAGWFETLGQFSWDVLIADEAHTYRSWTTAKKTSETRAERALEFAGHIGRGIRIPRVWMLTGTPFYGFTRDIFWPLEIAAGGLWSTGDRKLRGRGFMARYCALKRNAHALEAKGRSIYAETELMRRLEGTRDEAGNRRFDGVMIQRTREEMFADTPPIERQVVRLDLEGTRPFIPGRSKRGSAGLAKLIIANNDLKREEILDRLLDELAEGNKILVYTFHVASAKKTFVALEKAMKAPLRRNRMREVNAKAWLSTGASKGKKTRQLSPESEPETVPVIELDEEQKAAWASDSDARYRLARIYREHAGAGVIVATIDSMPGALSLKGASSVHFLDMHWSPGAMAQAETRPWYPGVRDLTVIYYVARNSVDDHIEAEVLPKVETFVKMARDAGAEAILNAFGAEDETRSVDAIWDRLTKHLHLDAPEDLE